MARNRILFACLALAAPAIPATATAAPLLPESTLILSVQQELGSFDNTLLNCDPASGPHKNAKTACDDLAPVNGDFTRLPQAEALCTMELNPTKAKLHGTWRGKKVDFEETFSNPCVMRVNTAKVFDF
ncbi:SSI family serine proteinase inhibitor [Lentzea sp. HUAS TT2]|uniref:SSI family serine proteinase inhibitor n=1 Tax=Lentzea sp. HUAS TT2 TaxID=3447454 RepID=UPI003F701C40